jgi:hypothetical protein
MPISRGQMPRQQYGLGSFVKSIGKGVKSAVSGVKDFVKSDTGKMLGLAALGFGIPGTSFGGLFGRASFMVPGGKAVPGLLGFEGIGPALQAAQTKLGLDVADPKKGPTLGQFGKVFALGSLGGGALAALEAAGLDTDNPNEMPRDVESLKAYLRQGYKQLNQEASPEQVEAFVTANTTEYKADGGRIGYADGMNDPSDLPRGLQIDTTTRNPIPENALQEEIESVVRIMMGPGSAGIGEPEDGTMKGYQFFRKQYLPKKIKELSENFGYSEDEIYKMLNLKVREFKESPELLQKPKMAMGGRIGLEGGTNEDFQNYLKGREKFEKQRNYEQLYKEYLEDKRKQKVAEQKTMAANGGRIGYAFGNDPEQNAVEASGIMNLPLNQNPAGATELDLRETGGFIPPVGVKEKEDDIPAMLSNNEFVFTADAVRGMGDGDVNKGAQRMYDMMKKLEGGGRV